MTPPPKNEKDAPSPTRVACLFSFLHHPNRATHIDASKRGDIVLLPFSPRGVEHSHKRFPSLHAKSYGNVISLPKEPHFSNYTINCRRCVQLVRPTVLDVL